MEEEKKEEGNDERKGKVEGERGKAARSRRGLFGDRRRRRAKNEQNGSEGTRLELYPALPCFALPLVSPPSPYLISPHLTTPHHTTPHLTAPHLTAPHRTSPHLASSGFASPRLVSPRLCLPARHETANTPGLKLSFSCQRGCTPSSSWSSSFFYPC